jgi:hypothetical protein
MHPSPSHNGHTSDTNQLPAGPRFPLPSANGRNGAEATGTAPSANGANGRDVGRRSAFSIRN